VFRRVDLPRRSTSRSARSTSATPAWPRPVGRRRPRRPKVNTVEHLLSACAGLGLDNLYVDITAEEVPILDGSAASFVFLLQSAGIELQDAPKRFLRVLKPVEVREGEGGARSGRASSRTTATRWLRDRVRPPGGRLRPASASSSTWARAVQARDRPRAHLRLHQGRRDDAVARPGARRQHGQRGRRRRLQACSTARACATTTSSSSTRSSMRSATCGARPAAAGRLQRLQVRPRAEQPAAARAARPTARPSRSSPSTTSGRRSPAGSSAARPTSATTRSTAISRARRAEGADLDLDRGTEDARLHLSPSCTTR
jgi:hypothetical protein